MNLLVTNLCNGKCPYCFAADTMYGETGKAREHEMSLENLSIALDYLANSDPDGEIRLMGGEPTKHSRLGEVLSMIERKGLKKVVIFSNGIIDEKTRKVLREYRHLLTLVWNVNEPGLYPASVEKTIYASMREFEDVDSTLGFNIYRTDYDPAFALEILRTYPKIRKVRIGIAHPMGSESPLTPQKAVYIKDYPQVGRIVRDFVYAVARSPDFSHVESVVLDCGYAPCLWNKEDYAELKKIGIFDMREEDSGCTPEITDFSTELEVRPCFTKAEGQTPPRKATDFHTVEQAIAYNAVRYWIAREFLPPASAKCETCEDRERCFGGCGGERVLQAKLRMAKAEFRLKSPKTSRSEKIDALFELGTLSAASYDYDRAVRLLEDAVALSKSSFRLFRTRKIRKILHRFKVAADLKTYADDRAGIVELKREFVKKWSERVFDRKLFSSYTATLLNACFDWKTDVREDFQTRLARMPGGRLSDWKLEEVSAYLEATEGIAWKIRDPWALLGRTALVRLAKGDEAANAYLDAYFAKNPAEENAVRDLAALESEGVIGDGVLDLLRSRYAP